ncbi:hypothetical protein HGH93_12055 [Chitinophaga polysaccharea]|uniref:hypothetical protein n=1 Tax=Chitinophaga polysaccharea TaxID=1293035 RepID=UPI001454F62C|nr:hypothetical protein [Chitinophaga polysaccharea]NLR58840.1 hypothetical protein [Chitinophaga polysaccharea]
MKLVTTMRVLFFILGVVTTISTSQLFKSCRDPELTPVAVLPAGEQVQQQKVLAAYDQRIAELTTDNASLQQQVTDNRAALNRTIRKAATLEAQLEQQVADMPPLTDTVARLTNCDSIVQTAVAFAASAAQNDSLYQQLTTTLEQQVQNRDSTIAVQQQQQNYLQLNYDRNLAQQQLLLSENLQLHKDIRRHRVKNRLLSAGLLLLSGTATYMALHH